MQRNRKTHMQALSVQISRAAFKESGVYQRKHFHLCCVFSSAPHVCIVYVCYVLFPLCVNYNNNNSPVLSLSPSEADGVCDKQGVPGLSEVVSSGRLSSTSASHRIRRSLRGELLVRPALSFPKKMLLQWLWTHLPGPSQSIQR